MKLKGCFGLSQTVDSRILGEHFPVYQAMDSNQKPLIETLAKVLSDAEAVLLSFRKEDVLDFPELFPHARNSQEVYENDYHDEVSV